MKSQEVKPVLLDQYLDCFGSMSLEDAVCRKFCALNLRCAIEKEQNIRMDIIDDIELASGQSIRYQ
jgi:hypothetical protein